MNVLALFRKNEQKVEGLYKIYSLSFSGSRKIWEKLSKEERKHAKEFCDLELKFGNDKKLFEINKHSKEILKNITNFINKEFKRADSISLEEALETGLRIEQSMIENKCFEIFIPKIAEIEKVLKKINNDTKRHAELLRKEMKKI